MLKYVGIIIIVILIIGVLAFAIKPTQTSVSTSTPIASSTTLASATPNPAGIEESLESQIKTQLIAEHGPSAASLVVSVDKTERDYAQGTADDPAGGGGMWFAVNLGGQWKLIWDGNGNIMCDEIKEYPDLPSSMIPECYDEATNKLNYR